jgi:hypothetical protein
MPTRALGALLAAIAATLFVLSIVTAAWWDGHPRVDGHVFTAKDVHIGLLGGEGCNTGGAGACQSLELGPTFTITGYVELAAIGLATMLVLLVAGAAWRVSDERKRLAKAAIAVAALAAAGALALLVIGPQIKTTQKVEAPIGWGVFVFGGGVAAVLLASLVTMRVEREPLRLKTSAAAPPAPGFDVREILREQHDGLRPAALGPEPMLGPGASGSLPGPAGPLGVPLLPQAPQLRPLYDVQGAVPAPATPQLPHRAPTPIPRASAHAMAGLDYERPPTFDSAETAQNPRQPAPPGFDPRAGSPGAPPGFDPHAGSPGAPPGFDPRAGAPGAAPGSVPAPSFGARPGSPTGAPPPFGARPGSPTGAPPPFGARSGSPTGAPPPFARPATQPPPFAQPAIARDGDASAPFAQATGARASDASTPFAQATGARASDASAPFAQTTGTRASDASAPFARPSTAIRVKAASVPPPPSRPSVVGDAAADPLGKTMPAPGKAQPRGAPPSVPPPMRSGVRPIVPLPARPLAASPPPGPVTGGPTPTPGIITSAPRPEEIGAARASQPQLRSSQPTVAHTVPPMPQIDTPPPQLRAETENDSRLEAAMRETDFVTAVEIDAEAKAAAKATRAHETARAGTESEEATGISEPPVPDEVALPRTTSEERAAIHDEGLAAHERGDVSGDDIDALEMAARERVDVDSVDDAPAQNSSAGTAEGRASALAAAAQGRGSAPAPAARTPAPVRPPLSTAPPSLPPPKTANIPATGPTPACPQCESPMAWVEEHLRFYCKSCRMYF